MGRAGSCYVVTWDGTRIGIGLGTGNASWQGTGMGKGGVGRASNVCILITFENFKQNRTIRDSYYEKSVLCTKNKIRWSRLKAEA